MKIRNILLAFAFALATTGCAWVVVSANPALLPPEIDLLQYWSGAKLFSTGGNPYSEVDMQAAQGSFAQKEGTIRLWNPPVIFPFIAALTNLDFAAARLGWFLLGIFVLTANVVILLTSYPCYIMRTTIRIPLYLVLLSFVPVVEMLSWGQSGWILLVSVVGWWVLFREWGLTSFCAGFFLSVSAIKPHLIAPLYAALVLSSFQLRQFRLAVGFTIGLALWAALPLYFRNDIWSLYLHAMAHPPIYWRTPNLGSLLQGASGVHSLWMRHLPLGISLTLGTLLFVTPKFRELLTQRETFLYLVPLSLLVSPYGWLYDQVVILPLFFELAYQAHKRKSAGTSLLLCALGSVFMLACLPSSLGQERGIFPLLVYSLVCSFGLWRVLSDMKPLPTRDSQSL